MLKIKYVWHTLAKLSSFAIFGVGSLILATSMFPIFHVLSGFSQKRFQKISRKFIQKSFVVFVHYMEFIHAIRITVEDKEKLKGVSSKVIIANHPSILDVVLLISLIPNADCIVKGTLINNWFISKIIRDLYIPNSISFEEQLERAKKSMQNGNNLIIFPEGTRSTTGEPWQFKKGAARFALYSGSSVLPIYFGGNEKIGLRKHDKMFQYHPTERYSYELKVLPEISVSEYNDIPMSKSAIQLTEKMHQVLEQQKKKEK